MVQVDEQGTVAAAATAVAVGALAIDEPFPVVIDHPFMFLIRDTTNGSILFTGRVADPRQN
jgi:serpin B